VLEDSAPEVFSHLVAWCLEVHDLWISKAVAGRPKDTEFCQALAQSGIVDRQTLLDRLADIGQLNPRIRETVESRIRAI